MATQHTQLTIALFSMTTVGIGGACADKEASCGPSGWDRLWKSIRDATEVEKPTPTDVDTDSEVDPRKLRERLATFSDVITFVGPQEVAIGCDGTGTGPNYANRDVRPKDLKDRVLLSANFAGARMMDKVTFDGRHLPNSCFYKAIGNGTSFNGAIGNGTSFNGAYCEGCQFVGAELQYAKFIDSHMWKADFAYSVLYEADFTDADLQNANFCDAEFDKSTIFLRADLNGATFCDPRFDFITMWRPEDLIEEELRELLLELLLKERSERPSSPHE